MLNDECLVDLYRMIAPLPFIFTVGEIQQLFSGPISQRANQMKRLRLGKFKGMLFSCSPHRFTGMAMAMGVAMGMGMEQGFSLKGIALGKAERLLHLNVCSPAP